MDGLNQPRSSLVSSKLEMSEKAKEWHKNYKIVKEKEIKLQSEKEIENFKMINEDFHKIDKSQKYKIIADYIENNNTFSDENNKECLEIFIKNLKNN